MFMDAEIKKRYKAFWDHELYERAVLYLTVTSGSNPYPEYGTLEEKWTSLAYKRKEIDWALGNTAYYADGFMNWFVNAGPGVLASMLGADHIFAKSTVWFGLKPELNSAGEAVNLIPNFTKMGKAALDMTESCGSYCEGRYAVSITDLGEGLDTLAALRGTENLLTDTLEDPEGLAAACDYIDAAWEDAYRTFCETVKKYNPDNAVTTWMPIWSQSRWYPLECDFSVMLSPEGFARFVMPTVKRHARYLDNSVFHLDGEDAVKHLPQLLQIAELDGIQWTPGAGKPNVADERWFPMYEKIQGAGKNLVLIDSLNVNETLFLLGNLSQKGLYICSPAASKEEALEITAKAVEYAKGNKK